MGDLVEWARGVLMVDEDADLQEVYENTDKALTSCITDDQVSEVRHAKDIVVSMVRAQMFLNGDKTAWGPVVTEKNTPYQSIILFILQRLREHHYRKMDDSCFESILHANQPVQAWRKICTLREFVVRETRRDIEPEMYRCLMTSRDNCDTVVRHLLESKHAEFLDLEVKDNLISWHNGLYNLEHNVFFPFETRAHWARMTAAVHDERSMAGWECEIDVPDEDSYACHFTDKVFRDVTKHEDLVRELDRMVSELGIANSGCFYAMMGRLLFAINTLDRWQVMTYLRTSADVDSVAFKAFMDVFTACVGSRSTSSICSGTSLENVIDRRVCIALMRDIPPLEQGDWQLAVCGEHVCTTMNGKPRAFEWTSHILGVGPTLTYRNDAKTVDRRIVLFDMTQTTHENVSDFRDFVLDNIDIWFQTITGAYLEMSHSYGRDDIWQSSALPAEIHEMRSVVRELSDPLHNCITSDMFVLDEFLYMPLSNFKLIYYEYRRRRNLPQQRWVMQHWQATFHDLSLCIVKEQREYHGTKSTTEWICGIDTTGDRKEKVSTGTVEMLCTRESKLEGDLANLRAEIQFTRELVDVESSIDDLKTRRKCLQQQLQELNAVDES